MKEVVLQVLMWVIWNVISIVDFYYSILSGRIELIIVSGSEFALSFTVLFLIVYYTYKNDYYLESEEKFKERIYRIQCHDGNHMLYLTSLVQDRERRKANRKEVWFLKDK
mgnify:FL=1